jgi:hypothetical protein
MLSDKQDNKKLSYYVKASLYSDKYIDRLFPSDKWVKVRDSDRAEYKTGHKPIDYIYLDGKYYYDKANYGLPAIVKNIVGDEKREITLKNNLMINLAKLTEARKYIMPQLELDLINFIPGGKSNSKYQNSLARLKSNYVSQKTYIFKPVSEYAGEGIQIITNFSALMRYIHKIIKDYQRQWNTKTNPDTQKKRIWVLQEYLTDPLLLNGYKFHIRHYLFYAPGGTSYYLDKGELAPAREKYISGDWHNTKIHDTHFYGSDGDFFPDVLNLPDSVLKSINQQIGDFYSLVIRCINAQCYPENKHCYELFGVDLMITSDYKVKILEINAKIGMPSEESMMSRIIFEGSLNKIVLPMLGLPTSHIPDKYVEHFIPIRQNKHSSFATKKLMFISKTHKHKSNKITRKK